MRHKIFVFFSYLMIATSAFASPTDEAKAVALNYYDLLQQYASDVANVNVIEKIEKLFIDNEGGLVYNDLMQYKENGLGIDAKPDEVSHYLTTIGYLHINQHIDLRFHVDPTKFKFTSEKTQSLRESESHSITTYIIIEKEVFGLPVGKVTCSEMMAVEDGKIKTINYNDSETKLLEAIKEYKKRNYVQAFNMFRKDTEQKLNSESAYWLTIMLLKNQGAINSKTGRDYPKNVRHAMALYYMSKYNMYSLLNLFKVGYYKPNTDSNTAFNDGLLMDVNRKGKIGFLNEQGQYVIPQKYSYARNFHEGIAALAIDRNNWGFVDISGKNITNFRYEYTEVRDFCNGLAAVKNSQSKWGYIDKRGKLVIDFEYDDAGDFNSENKAKVKKKGRVFYIFKDKKINSANKVYKHS